MTEINDWQKETSPENDIALAKKFGWVGMVFISIAVMIEIAALQDNDAKLPVMVALVMGAAFFAKILETSFLRRAVIRLISANRVGGEACKPKES